MRGTLIRGQKEEKPSTIFKFDGEEIQKKVMLHQRPFIFCQKTPENDAENTHDTGKNSSVYLSEHVFIEGQQASMSDLQQSLKYNFGQNGVQTLNETPAGRLDQSKDSVSGDSAISNLNDINLSTLNKLTGF